jgi:hypothetical protein
MCKRTKFYNKMPGYINELDTGKAFKKQLKSFLFFGGGICLFVVHNV